MLSARSNVSCTLRIYDEYSMLANLQLGIMKELYYSAFSQRMGLMYEKKENGKGQ